MDNLQRAAEHIGAVKLPDGYWAHYADETCRWYVVTAAELAALCIYLDDDNADIRRSAYSHWCAACPGEEQHSEWEPEAV